MKIRTDFVTNSSSSSFILVFDTETDLQRFQENCSWLNYKAFAKLVKDGLKDPECINKDAIIETLRVCYLREHCDDIGYIESKIGRSCDYSDFKDYLKKEHEILESDEYKNEMERRLKETDFEEKKQRILNADSAVLMTVWDSNGGIMEWAIRNGFVSEEFWQYCLLDWPVG